MRRWAKAGVLDRVFEEMQREQIVRVKFEAVLLDSANIEVNCDGAAAQTVRGPLENLTAGGTPRVIWLPQLLERL
jgi:hypothetical protein